MVISPQRIASARVEMLRFVAYKARLSVVMRLLGAILAVVRCHIHIEVHFLIFYLHRPHPPPDETPPAPQHAHRSYSISTDELRRNRLLQGSLSQSSHGGGQCGALPLPTSAHSGGTGAGANASNANSSRPASPSYLALYRARTTEAQHSSHSTPPPGASSGLEGGQGPWHEPVSRTSSLGSGHGMWFGPHGDSSNTTTVQRERSIGGSVGDGTYASVDLSASAHVDGVLVVDFGRFDEIVYLPQDPSYLHV